MPVDATTPLAVNVWIGEKAPPLSVPNVTVRLVRPIAAGKVSLVVNTLAPPQIYVAGGFTKLSVVGAGTGVTVCSEVPDV